MQQGLTMANDKSKATYRYASLPSYTPLDRKKIAEHADRVRSEVIPQIKKQADAKEEGVQRLKTRGLHAKK